MVGTFQLLAEGMGGVADTHCYHVPVVGLLSS